MASSSTLGARVSAMMPERVRNIGLWVSENRKYLAWLGMTAAGSKFLWESFHRIPPGHVGILVDRKSGKVGPWIYDESQFLMMNPLEMSYLPMRLIPVKKRMIRSYKTKDDKDVEVHLVCRLQPKIHWVPEIYDRFGRDYGRGFLDKEGHMDIKGVCEQHDLQKLVNPKYEAHQLQVIEELKERLADACAFYHIKLSNEDTEIYFSIPEY